MYSKFNSKIIIKIHNNNIEFEKEKSIPFSSRLKKNRIIFNKILIDAPATLEFDLYENNILIHNFVITT